MLRERIASLVFDRLVMIGPDGRPQPSLATAWQADPDQRRWIFDLRPGVTLHDGNALAGRLVAASLAAGHPNWRVSVEANAGQESVLIVAADPQPNLLAELAMSRNSIVARAADGALIGSGPFRVQDWQPGRHATLAANSAYWGGRPFLNSIEIQMGRPLREQELDYRLDRADVIEISPEQARRASQNGEHVDVSSPVDVLGILFPPESGADQQHLRQALSYAIDRATIQSVLMQRQGEAAGGLLPNWISGYAFVFSTRADLERARQERNAAGGAAQVVLAFDASDPLERAIAERVAVNARDAGINVQPFAAGGVAHAPASAARIAVLHLPSATGPVALAASADALGRTEASTIAGVQTAEALYATEREMLGVSRFVPIVSYGEALAIAPRVTNWQPRRDGAWPLADVSLQEVP